MERVSFSKLRLGPIRHETLPDHVLARAKAIQDRCHKHLGTLEDFERDLMRDADPESELRVWEQIADCFERYHKRYPLGTKEEERLIIGILVVFSMGSTPKELPHRHINKKLYQFWQGKEPKLSNDITDGQNRHGK